MTYTGKMRVYFNRHGAEPFMWCVSPEDRAWELGVRGVDMEGMAVLTVYKKKETPDEEDGQPSAWLSVAGTLSIGTTGFARIR